MKKSKTPPLEQQQPVVKVERRRWRAPRSPLASSVSPAFRAAVQKLDEMRAELLAAVSGPRPPRPGV